MYIDETIIAGLLTVAFVLAFLGGLAVHIVNDMKKNEQKK